MIGPLWPLSVETTAKPRASAGARIDDSSHETMFGHDDGRRLRVRRLERALRDEIHRLDHHPVAGEHRQGLAAILRRPALHRPSGRLS
jgi:hypothetical protein